MASTQEASMEDVTSKFTTVSADYNYSSFGPAGEFIAFAFNLKNKLTQLPGNQNHELIDVIIEDDPYLTWVRVTFNKLPPRFVGLKNWGEDSVQSFIEVQFRTVNGEPINSDLNAQIMRIARNDKPHSVPAVDSGDSTAKNYMDDDTRYGKVTPEEVVQSAKGVIEEFENFIQAELQRAGDLSRQISCYNNMRYQTSSELKLDRV
jgi:hypothetical protein